MTKRSPPEWIRPLVACGARDLGENYPQELWRKAEALVDLGDSVRWHLIGHLQTNKVKKSLPMVRMIHSVYSLKLLQVLDESAATLPTPPAVCLQVNTSGEASSMGTPRDSRGPRGDRGVSGHSDRRADDDGRWARRLDGPRAHSSRYAELARRSATADGLAPRRALDGDVRRFPKRPSKKGRHGCGRPAPFEGGEDDRDCPARRRHDPPVVAQPGGERAMPSLATRRGSAVAVNAPPDKGKANEAIQSVLAENLGCKPAQIAMISGTTSRQKRFPTAVSARRSWKRRLSVLLARTE